jgi:hypothetical protein
MWNGGSGPRIVEGGKSPARRSAQMRQCKVLRRSNRVSCPCGARWQCPFAYTLLAVGNDFDPQGDEEFNE